MPVNENDVAALKSKLDVIIRLLAAKVVSEDRSVKDNAVELSRAGLTPTEIATILGTTSNTVNVALSNARKSKKRKAKKA